MPSQKKRIISPLLILKKGTGRLTSSNSIQKNKCLFRTAQLHKKTLTKSKHAGDGRTPAGEGMLHLLSASFSVEAAAVFPLFIAAMCILMYPMRIMSSQIEAQGHMEQAGELISAAEAMKTSAAWSLRQGKKGPDTCGTDSGTPEADGSGTSAGSAATEAVSESGDIQNSAVSQAVGESTYATVSKAFQVLETAGSGAAIFAGFDSDVLGFPVITQLKVPDETDPCTEIHVSCFVNYPLSGLIGTNISVIKMTSRRRAWVGRKGGAGRHYDDGNRSQDGDEETEDEDQEKIVYVARNSVNSGRYHTKKTCHYISNTMTSVSASEIDSLRSSDGGKYHACPSCRPGTSGIVYIFKSGNAFHASKDCKAIQSYAVEITLKEAKERGLTQCLYCSRSQ